LTTSAVADGSGGPAHGPAHGPAQGGAHGAAAVVPAAGPAFSAPLTAAALGLSLGPPALLIPHSAEWLTPWRVILDLAISVGLVAFVAGTPLLWLVQALFRRARRRARLQAPGLPEPSAAAAARQAAGAGRPGGRRAAWPLALLVVCLFELLSHAGERNGFLATSRPESGVERWTTADGYALLLDGIPAQGDGAFLLPAVRLFLGDAPPQPSEFDRRAGHMYLVALLARVLGGYWAFAAVNLVAWWAAALAVWWLGRRRWPGSYVPEIASLLTATGLGFVFMGAAPQAHAPAFASFALVLALCDRLSVWSPGAKLADWAKAGWAIGASGLIYLVYLPALLFIWLYGLRGGRLAGLALASALALGIVLAWQGYGSLLGLQFAGGNNDLAGEAMRGWISVVRRGPNGVLGQLHAGSPRGLLGGAFYYPWWLLAVVGFATSGRESRRWAVAVLVAGFIPAVAFSTRFHLPRLAYFMYPAFYLLAAQGIAALAGAVMAWRRAARGARLESASARWLRWVVVGALAAALVAAVNVDLFGNQQLNLWFHYSQGNAW
jgi:hypothetical protein